MPTADACKTYNQDERTLTGRCNFILASPTPNVDLVDAKRIKGDRRMPFGLPGINKKSVSIGNYLWIIYFRRYLSDEGRYRFVMSFQASSTGHGEKVKTPSMNCVDFNEF